MENISQRVTYILGDVFNSYMWLLTNCEFPWTSEIDFHFWAAYNIGMIRNFWSISAWVSSPLWEWEVYIWGRYDISHFHSSDWAPSLNQLVPNWGSLEIRYSRPFSERGNISFGIEYPQNSHPLLRTQVEIRF